MTNESEVQFALCNQCGSSDCDCEPEITYRLLDKNPRRFIRGKEHAKFMVIEDGQDLGYLWMSSTLKKMQKTLHYKETPYLQD
jgi:hypothetical protein